MSAGSLIAAKANATVQYLVMHAAPYLSGRLLDVGCGRQPYRRIFFENVKEWVGLDIRPVSDIEADAHRIPEDDATFDTVLCTDLLHICVSPQQVVQEMARVLKPGGHLIIVAPQTEPDENVCLYTFHTQGLEVLCSMAGLIGIPDLLTTIGGTIRSEMANLALSGEAPVPLGPDHEGWTQQMDKRYPMLATIVARKGEAK